MAIPAREEQQNTSLISVIMPVYNDAGNIEESLATFFKQTIADQCEVVCIDDGSTDSSLEVLQRIQEEHPANMVVISQKNAGSGPARNAGICRASGEFIYFLDSDDAIPSTDVLENLYRAAHDHNVRIAGGSFSRFDGSVRTTDFSKDEHLSKYTFEQPGIIEFCDYQFEYGYQRFIFNRRMLVDNGIVFPAYLRYQDPPFLVDAMVAAERFYAIEEVTYCYRDWPHIAWNSAQVCDMIRGLHDVAAKARSYGLTDLMRTGVKRLVEEWAWAVREQIIAQRDKETLITFCVALDDLRTTIDDPACLTMIEKTPTSLDEILRALDLLAEAWAKGDKLNDEVGHLHSEIDHLHGEISHLHSEIDHLHNEAGRLTEEIACLNAQKNELSEEIERLHGEISCRDARITELTESTAWKTGRAVTALPRAIKKTVSSK